MATTHSVPEAVELLRSKLNPQIMDQIQTVFNFQFKDTNENYTLDAHDNTGLGWLSGTPEANNLQAAIRITLTSTDFTKLVFGELNPMAGMATGRMWLKGDFKQAIKLDKLLKE